MSISDAELARQAAGAGAAVVRSRFREPFDRFAKVGLDFATDVDIAAERAVTAVLREQRPSDGVSGEELGAIEGTSRRRWLVDPLCGTANFAAGTGPIGVNVALEDGGLLTAAATADPLTGDVFWADGAGAFVRRGGEDLPLAPSAHTLIVDVILDGPWTADRWFRPHPLVASPEFMGAYAPRAVSTSLALAWVAAGHRAAYLGDVSVAGSVHFSAGIALCRAAGAVVTDLLGGPVESGEGLLAAADEATSQALVAMIRAAHA